MKAIALDGWAGRTYCPVEIVGETPKRYRVKVLKVDGVNLPGGRFAAFEQVVLVPKQCICDDAEGKSQGGPLLG